MQIDKDMVSALLLGLPGVYVGGTGLLGLLIVAGGALMFGMQSGEGMASSLMFGLVAFVYTSVSIGLAVVALRGAVTFGGGGDARRARTGIDALLAVPVITQGGLLIASVLGALVMHLLQGGHGSLGRALGGAFGMAIISPGAWISYTPYFLMTLFAVIAGNRLAAAQIRTIHLTGLQPDQAALRRPTMARVVGVSAWIVAVLGGIAVLLATPVALRHPMLLVAMFAMVGLLVLMVVFGEQLRRAQPATAWRLAALAAAGFVAFPLAGFAVAAYWAELLAIPMFAMGPICAALFLGACAAGPRVQVYNAWQEVDVDEGVRS